MKIMRQRGWWCGRADGGEILSLRNKPISKWKISLREVFTLFLQIRAFQLASLLSRSSQTFFSPNLLFRSLFLSQFYIFPSLFSVGSSPRLHHLLNMHEQWHHRRSLFLVFLFFRFSLAFCEIKKERWVLRWTWKTNFQRTWFLIEEIQISKKMKEKTLKSWECENYVKKGNHKIKYPRKIRGENFKNIKWIKKVIISTYYRHQNQRKRWKWKM